MEQSRVVIAVILSILVILVWDLFFIPDTPPPRNLQQVTPEEQVAGQPKKPFLQEKPVDAKPVDVSEAATIPEETVVEKTTFSPIFVETPLYSVELSGPQACFTGFRLKQYREEKSEGSPFKRLVSENNIRGTGCVDFRPEGITEKKKSGFTPVGSVIGPLEVRQTPGSLTFTRRITEDVFIEKRYTFIPDSYAIDLDVTIQNHSGAPLNGNLGVALHRYFSGNESRFVFEGPCSFSSGKLEEIKLKDIEENPSVSGPFSWIAMQSRYFMSAVIPGQGQDHAAAVMTLAQSESGVVTAEYQQSLSDISPRAMTSLHFTLYMGPKEIDILKSVGSNLDRAVDFGWFDMVARPCLWLMKHIYRIIPNYGISIILVTLIIKLLFWPLGTKSYKSMGEMKKIQPLMAEIREKYKDDKQKMNQEMMGLYKTYKVNPLGGCLPMLVQIPVFIAFYRMLYQAIELRHAPFLLWINDLSAPERLFSFDVSLPLMQPPIGIPVLTIIMGATMFLQQKMQPSPGDPTQARMMLLMPIFLTVIFINFPSGLVLYFIVNNLFSIFQQNYVTRTKS